MRCGYSPIITSNTTLNTQPENVTLIGKISEFIPIASWAWGLNQPTTNLSAANLTLVANLPPLQANLSAPAINWLNNSTYGYNCVALYEDGFRVDNCYNEYPFACLKINSTTTWQTTKDKKAYFESVNEDSCPSGYSFAVPRLADNVLELIRAMLSASLEYPIWVDLNDITVTNCFVSGGPYAQCPYKQTVSRSKIVKMIAPSFSVAAFIIILVLLEKFLRINPIQTNRKTYWKRVINEYNEKHDYEGVPS